MLEELKVETNKNYIFGKEREICLYFLYIICTFLAHYKNSKESTEYYW